MPKLIIESAEEKTSQKGRKYWIVSVDGKKAICFNDKTPGLIGKEVEATLEETTDDMGNARRFLKLSGDAAFQKKSWGKSPEEQDNIMRQSSVKTAFEYGAVVGLNTEQCFTLAEEIFAWVKGKK